MYKKFDLELRKQDPQIPSLVHLKWVQTALDTVRPWTSTSWDSLRSRRNNGSLTQRSSERGEMSTHKDATGVFSIPDSSASPVSIKLESSPRLTTAKPLLGPTSPYVTKSSNHERGPWRLQNQNMFGSLKVATQVIPTASASPRQPQSSSNSRSRPLSARAISTSRKNMSEMLDQIIEPLMRPSTATAVSASHRHAEEERIVPGDALQSSSSHFQPLSTQSLSSSMHGRVQTALLQASPPLLKRSERPSTAPARPSTGLKRPLTVPTLGTQTRFSASLSTVANTNGLKADEPDRVKAPTTMAERQERLKREKDAEGRLMRALLSDLDSLRQKLVLVQSQLDDSYHSIVLSQTNQDALLTKLERANFSWAIAEKEIQRLHNIFGRINTLHDSTTTDDFATENEGSYTTGASQMLIAALKLENLLDEASASNDLQDAQVDQAKKLLNAMMTFGVRTSGLTKCASISTQTD